MNICHIGRSRDAFCLVFEFPKLDKKNLSVKMGKHIIFSEENL